MVRQRPFPGRRDDAEIGLLVTGPWQYEEIPDASHWVPVDAPGRLTELLLEWFS